MKLVLRALSKSGIKTVLSLTLFFLAWLALTIYLLFVKATIDFSILLLQNLLTAVMAGVQVVLFIGIWYRVGEGKARIRALQFDVNRNFSRVERENKHFNAEIMDLKVRLAKLEGDYTAKIKVFEQYLFKIIKDNQNE